MNIRVLSSLICFSTLLAGCTIPKQNAPEAPPTQEALAQLQSVQEKYGSGQYGEVIRSVATSDEIAAAPTSVRIPAYKLQAFSYCISKYTQLCEESFARILRLDPAFELAPNEAGHPIWGPAFQRAKSQAQH